MFSTPIVRALEQNENTDRLMARKAGSVKISRKPFADRCVNGRTPEITQPVKNKIPAKKIVITVDDDEPDFYEDFCSYIDDVDDLYEENLPDSERLSKHIGTFIDKEYGRNLATPSPVFEDYTEHELVPINSSLDYDDDFFKADTERYLPQLNDSLDVSLPQNLSSDYDDDDYSDIESSI